MCRSEARCGASTSVQPNLQDDSDIQQTGSQASPAGESAAASEYRGSPYDAQRRSLFFSLSALVSASADTVMLHMFACLQSWQLLSHHITSHHITSHHITSHHITSHHITSHVLCVPLIRGQACVQELN